MRYILAALAVLCLSACNNLAPVQPEDTYAKAADSTVDSARRVWVIVKYIGNWDDKSWNPPIIIRRNGLTGWKNSTELYVNPDTRIGMSGWDYWTGDLITTDILAPDGFHRYTYTYLTKDTTITIYAQ